MQAEMIEALPWIFSWNGGGQQALELVQASGIDHATSAIHRAFDIIGKADPELAQSTRDCLQGLSRKRALRFMTAPETLHRISVLHDNPAVHISFLCNSLKAERALDNADYHPTRPCWTALGDFYFNGMQGGASGDQAVDARDSRWTPQLNFRAPLVGDAIPVDFVSPYARAASPSRFPFEAYEPGEAKAVWAALQDTFTRTASVAPAAQLITRFCKVIIPRKHGPEKHTSSSRTSYPGQMLLRNPQNADAGMLASSMIHESIHHFLYTIEFSRKFVGLEFGKLIPSAWTGRLLSLHSYLHACFVWYGLAQFWQKNLDSSVFEPQMARNELAQALSGFRPANPVDRLLPYAGEFRSEALEAAGALRDELRKSGAFDSQETCNCIISG